MYSNGVVSLPVGSCQGYEAENIELPLVLASWLKAFESPFAQVQMIVQSPLKAKTGACLECWFQEAEFIPFGFIYHLPVIHSLVSKLRRVCDHIVDNVDQPFVVVDVSCYSREEVSSPLLTGGLVKASFKELWITAVVVRDSTMAVLQMQE
jgi:hypothetical protein